MNSYLPESLSPFSSNFTSKTKLHMNYFLSVLFFFTSLIYFAQVQNNSDLKLAEIMKGNEFIGHQPEQVRWSADGTNILFDWNVDNEPGNSLYHYSLKQKQHQKASADFHKSTVEAVKAQENFAHLYFIDEGNLVHYNKLSKQKNSVFQSSDRLSNVQRIPGFEGAYFQQGLNLFVYDLRQGSIRQLTNFKADEEKLKHTDSTFLEKQQHELFEYVQDQNNRNKWQEATKINTFEFPKPYYIGKNTLENLRISADGEYISFTLSNYPTDKNTQVEHAISNDGYSFNRTARNKVSELEPVQKLAIYNLVKDTVYFAGFEKLSGIRQKPDFLITSQTDSINYSQDRSLVIHPVHYSDNGLYALAIIKSHDNKDRWIVSINIASGEIQELDRQRDEAWVGGPGISGWNSVEGTFGWLTDQETIYFQTEETGYSHVYTLNVKTGKRTALTSGNWEVHDVQLSKDGKRFYLTTNQTHPGNRSFYHLEISSKKLTPILIEDGNYEVALSPDEKTIAYRYSYKNKPWELFICPNEVGATARQLTTSTSEKFNTYNWRSPEVVTFKASDGALIYAREYKPEKENSNGAAVIFVHGAGYLQNAHNYWSSYYREYMFHNLLVDNGFTVLDIDYRASEGYGRDCRTAIYRHMGGRDLQDQVDGKNYLIKQLGIDSNRVGIYGGSYGGFITLMAMLTTPTEFPCGAALRSVTDWAHYNHPYTSNILNTPETDPEAYQKSSPIYFADKLQGRLLMLHGMVDDNVQFQDVVRLSQRFIELGKTNWDVAIYPIEAHGFKEAYSWTDEYRRIYELFYSELILKHTN
jgi:dipeptidyl aminopeptidase/acylaminoacyl peptidase